MLMMLNKLRSLLALTATSLFLAGLYSCSSSNPELTIKLDKLAPSDTIAWVTYLGHEGQQTDTLLHFEPTIQLSPDTSRFHSVIFSHDGATRVHYYMLQGKTWKEVTTMQVDTTKLTSVFPFEGVDLQGKSHTISELYAHHSVELVFASPEGLQSLTRQEQESLQAKVRPDSLQFVILYPTPSDSTARGQFRRDSLRGIAFSDSLGLVSRLRREYGVQGNDRPVRFQIDTLGRVKRH